MAAVFIAACPNLAEPAVPDGAGRAFPGAQVLDAGAMRRFFLLSAATLAILLAAGGPREAEAGLFDIFKRNPDQQVAPPPLPPVDLQQAAPAPDAAPVPVQSTTSEAQAALRMDRIEQQMRALTGQVEQLTYQVRQLQEELRVQSGGKRAAAAPPPAPAPSKPAAQASDPVAVAIAAQDAPADASAGPGAPPRPLGQIAVDPSADPNNPRPLDLGSLSGGGAATEPPPPTGSAQGDYDAAYDLVLKGDYDVAETSFRRFLASYPDDTLAGDAQYWLGESLYARQDYRGAADAFLAGYQQYPKNSKAPDMLLKLGLSLYGLGQRDAACSTYSEILKKYPRSSNALIQRVKAEQTNASC